MDKDVMLALADAINQQKNCALLTIVEYTGSSPRRQAAMLIDERGGIICGTIGGGAIEQKGIADGVAAIKSGEDQLKHYRLQMNPDDSEALQMACGGNVTLSIQVHRVSPRLVVIGAGHISQALNELATKLGYRYLVIDDRAEYLTNDRFPNAQCQHAPDMVAALQALPTHQDDAVVIVSHDHLHDLDALIALHEKPHFYLGMIGSKKKVSYVYHQMRERGIDFDTSQIHAPIGLQIGGETPAEIALSIMAEIQSVRYAKNGHNMKETLPCAR